jgi:hypothetical protein
MTCQHAICNESGPLYLICKLNIDNEFYDGSAELCLWNLLVLMNVTCVGMIDYIQSWIKNDVSTAPLSAVRYCSKKCCRTVVPSTFFITVLVQTDMGYWNTRNVVDGMQ